MCQAEVRLNLMTLCNLKITDLIWIMPTAEIFIKLTWDVLFGISFRLEEKMAKEKHQHSSSILWFGAAVSIEIVTSALITFRHCKGILPLFWVVFCFILQE